LFLQEVNGPRQKYSSDEDSDVEISDQGGEAILLCLHSGLAAGLAAVHYDDEFINTMYLTQVPDKQKLPALPRVKHSHKLEHNKVRRPTLAVAKFFRVQAGTLISPQGSDLLHHTPSPRSSKTIINPFSKCLVYLRILEANNCLDFSDAAALLLSW
jgi:hypothetical protein